jgi:3,4-dihydroxy 2-butanone 4-phosphate synthase/GTP cyclohydrolase II
MEKISKEGKGVAVLLSGDDYSQDIAGNLASVLAVGNEVSATSRPGSDLTIGTGSQILRDLGVGKMRLLSYPAKYPAISGFDLEVVEFVQFEK